MGVFNKEKDVCIHCGTMLGRLDGKYALADSVICFNCWKSLGFDTFFDPAKNAGVSYEVLLERAEEKSVKKDIKFANSKKELAQTEIARLQAEAEAIQAQVQTETAKAQAEIEIAQAKAQVEAAQAQTGLEAARRQAQAACEERERLRAQTRKMQAEVQDIKARAASEQRAQYEQSEQRETSSNGEEQVSQEGQITKNVQGSMTIKIKPKEGRKNIGLGRFSANLHQDEEDIITFEDINRRFWLLEYSWGGPFLQEVSDIQTNEHHKDKKRRKGRITGAALGTLINPGVGTIIGGWAGTRTNVEGDSYSNTTQASYIKEVDNEAMLVLQDVDTREIIHLSVVCNSKIDDKLSYLRIHQSA